MLLMVEKCIRGGICHSIYWYAKANDKKRWWLKESPHLQYCDINKLYGWTMSQKVSLNNF